MIGKFFHQALQWHAVLQGYRSERPDRVHQAADGTAFFGHVNEKLSWLAVLVETNGDVTFVTSDLELVRKRHTGVGHAVPDRLIHFAAQHRQFFFQLENAFGELVALDKTGCIALGYSPHVFCLARVKRRRALRAVAINRNGLQPKPPSFDVSIHDLVDCG